MARDIDIIRRKKVTVTATTKDPVLQLKTTPRPPNRSKSWFLLVLLVGLIMAAGGIYWKFAASGNGNQLRNVDTSSETGATANQSATKTVIWIYNVDAKSTSTNQLIQQLRRLDYEVIDSGKSQFKYTTTEIWYTADHLTDAQTIAALTSPKPTLRAAATSGSFDVLVYLSN